MFNFGAFCQVDHIPGSIQYGLTNLDRHCLEQNTTILFSGDALKEQALGRFWFNFK